MKGQMFFMATIVIIAGLLLARFSVRSPEISRQKMLLEMSYENEFFNNLKQELKNSILFSADRKENITNNAYDFMNFSRKKALERSLELRIFFVGVFSNFSNSSLKINSINLLNKKINVTLNLSGNVKEKELENYEKWDVFYQITPGTTYWLFITYDNSTRNLTLDTSSIMDIYFYYFDLNLTTQNAVHVEKIFEKNILP